MSKKKGKALIVPETKNCFGSQNTEKLEKVKSMMYSI